MPLPWPRLRGLAFWALLASVLVRTAQILPDYGLEGALAAVPLSGVLVWIAVACLAVSFLGAVRHRSGL